MENLYNISKQIVIDVFYSTVSQDITENQTVNVGMEFTEHGEPINGSSSKSARRRERRTVPGTGELFLKFLETSKRLPF